jgi:hypothetical protein
VFLRVLFEDYDDDDVIYYDYVIIYKRTKMVHLKVTLTGKSRIIRRTNCFSVIMSNKNPTVSVLGLNMGF